MPTTTRSRTIQKSAIELDPVDLGLSGSESGERSAGDERSEPGGRATRGAGGTLRAAAAGGRRAELSPELVDEAVNRARVRSAIGPLPGMRVSRSLIAAS